jgi:hypothetical protein
MKKIFSRYFDRKQFKMEKRLVLMFLITGQEGGKKSVALIMEIVYCKVLGNMRS